MDVATALGELSAAGSEQTRKTYRRHGAPEPLFGVSFATLRAMAKRLGVDHALAIGLWDTGNTDARCLAALIADPAQLTEATADAWAAATRYHTVIDLVAGVVARSPIALERMARWVGADDEHVARCGWTVMAQLAQHDRAIADAAFTPYLAVIERRIHDAPNSAREGMNTALIAIGGRSDALAEPAIAAARRIGEVVVDHGDTACQTPDAATYIAKVRAHQAKQVAAKPKVKAKAAAKPKPKPAAKPKPKSAAKKRR
ncbi:MAG: DNA alkylation repair protein [Myxococcales bacterium]|nr:DNA alkylation repair protein [Myxococcales bacterium]MBP6848176.1 DNA alkylation repair protein [Kofleriaceae bacterium]